MATANADTPPKLRKERTENAAKRRRQIIDATLRSVVKNGLAGTTLATVADEAGLSQGVAVFYFKNKQTLLGAVLRDRYEHYQTAWQQSLAEAGPRPVDQLIALVCADFAPEVCDGDSLVVWHAFWGESGARPAYAAISESYDATRFAAMHRVCAALFAEVGRPAAEAAPLAIAVDALTDGFWLRIYLSTGEMTRDTALEITMKCLAAMVPERAGSFLSIPTKQSSSPG